MGWDGLIASCDWGRGGTAESALSAPPFRELFSRAKNFRIPIWAQEMSATTQPMSFI